MIGSSFSNAELRASAFCGQRNRNPTEEIRDGPHLSTSVRLIIVVCPRFLAKNKCVLFYVFLAEIKKQKKSIYQL